MAEKEDEMIKKLYEYSEKLDAAGAEASKHKDLFQGILNGTSGPNKAKSLAAQLIPRYFKHFPDLLENGMNSLMDLCEEEELQIRILAVRAFPTICKDLPAALPRAADVLGQLLMTEIQIEVDNVKHSLLSLLRINTKVVLEALFTQILTRDKSQRERAIQFLREKLPTFRDELLSNKNEDVQQYFAEKLKEAMGDCTEEEFKTFLTMLQSLSIFKGEKQQEIVELLGKQADLDSDFKADDTDQLSRFLSCLNLARPYFQKGLPAVDKFMNYISTKLLPSLDKISSDGQTKLFQQVAHIATHATAENARQIIPPAYAAFKKLVPSTQEGNEDTKLELSQIECILYLLHQLGPKAGNVLHAACGVAPAFSGQPSDMVTETPQSQKNLEDFKNRISYLKNRIPPILSDADKALKGLSVDDPKREAAVILVKSTTNIREMLKPLSVPKPQFLGPKCSISFSWDGNQKKRKQAESSSAAASNGTAPAKRGRGVYVPPARQPGGVGRVLRGSAPRGYGFSRGRGAFVPRGRGRGRGFRGRGF